MLLRRVQGAVAPSSGSEHANGRRQERAGHDSGSHGCRSATGLRRTLVESGAARQVLVYDGDDCIGWCQNGTPGELPSIKNPRAHSAELDVLPKWRIGCIVTGSKHRGRGIVRAAVRAVPAEVVAAAADCWRPTPRRSSTESRNGARTCTPGPRRARSWASSGKAGSPSGAGSCVVRSNRRREVRDGGPIPRGLGAGVALRAPFA